MWLSSIDSFSRNQLIRCFLALSGLHRFECFAYIFLDNIWRARVENGSVFEFSQGWIESSVDWCLERLCQCIQNLITFQRELDMVMCSISRNKFRPEYWFYQNLISSLSNEWIMNVEIYDYAYIPHSHVYTIAMHNTIRCREKHMLHCKNYN